MLLVAARLAVEADRGRADGLGGYEVSNVPFPLWRPSVVPSRMSGIFINPPSLPPSLPPASISSLPLFSGVAHRILSHWQ